MQVPGGEGADPLDTVETEAGHHHGPCHRHPDGGSEGSEHLEHVARVRAGPLGEDTHPVLHEGFGEVDH